MNRQRRIGKENKTLGTEIHANIDTLYINKNISDNVHNESFHSLYRSPNIVRVIKSKRLSWTGHLA